MSELIRPLRLWVKMCVAAAAMLMACLTQAAWSFALTDVEGKPQRLADSAPDQWVVVNFWATWCAPCVKEIPEFAAFAKEEGARVRVIGIALDWEQTGNVETDRRKVMAFARKVGHTYPLVLGDAASEKTFGTMAGLPTTIIYRPDGKIAYKKNAPLTKEVLKRVIAGEKIP